MVRICKLKEKSTFTLTAGTRSKLKEGIFTANFLKIMAFSSLIISRNNEISLIVLELNILQFVNLFHIALSVKT